MVRTYSTHPKTELTRYHKRAERQGFVLEKSRKRDPQGQLYDRYWLYGRGPNPRGDRQGYEVLWRYGGPRGFDGLDRVHRTGSSQKSVDEFLNLGRREKVNFAEEFERGDYPKRTAFWDKIYSKLLKLRPL